MKAVILHGAVPPDAPRDELDTLVQVEAVRRALCELGHEVATVPLSLDLQDAAQAIRAQAPDFVFNLVESIERAGCLIHLAPALLDFLSIPYTGSGTDALYVTSNKLLTKRILRTYALPTAPWYSLDELKADGPLAKGPYITKPVWEHASVGLDEDSILVADRKEALREACLRAGASPCGECFAEAFIDGREFNIALLAAPGNDPEVLPPSEIQFVGYDKQRKWKVVGYRAKWDEESFEYAHTPREFGFRPDDRPLLDTLTELARRCWRVFRLRGYARVDFRVDKKGNPYILEVNANPCLSPDAGYAATIAQAGLSYNEVIHRILGDMRPGCPGRPGVSHSECRGSAELAEAWTPSAVPPAGGVTFREEVTETDRDDVRDIVESTGFFYPHEVGIAVELVDERLQKGTRSGYYFLFAEQGGKAVGYTCFGPIACTLTGYDLFWIAVHNNSRGRGLGRQLLERTEQIIARMGGESIYIETSNRAQYEPTRAFYLRCGYSQAAVLPEFYAPGDDRVIYVKRLPPPQP
jgi:D-alanine-D-alanine ligase-like ATP-grasp enzyme/GNAT superfamily N-acetyltransferase